MCHDRFTPTVDFALRVYHRKLVRSSPQFAGMGTLAWALGIVSNTTGRDLKGRVIEIWIAQYNDRPRVTVDPGDLWELNGGAIAKHMEALGIEVVRSAN